MTNWVTACAPCNQRKANTPLSEFAKTLGIDSKELPVHGDPIIDNRELPSRYEYFGNGFMTERAYKCEEDLLTLAVAATLAEDHWLLRASFGA